MPGLLPEWSRRRGPARWASSPNATCCASSAQATPRTNRYATSQAPLLTVRGGHGLSLGPGPAGQPGDCVTSCWWMRPASCAVWPAKRTSDAHLGYDLFQGIHCLRGRHGPIADMVPPEQPLARSLELMAYPPRPPGDRPQRRPRRTSLTEGCAPPDGPPGEPQAFDHRRCHVAPLYTVSPDMLTVAEAAQHGRGRAAPPHGGARRRGRMLA